MNDLNPQALGFSTQRLSRPIVWFLLLTVPALGLYGQAERGALTVQSKDAEQNLVKKVAPVYPPLARQARIQGIVKIEILISKTGTVDSHKVLNGHPLLVQAAINAVKLWQYKPFLVGGQPVTAVTVVEVPFYLGISDVEYEIEKENSQIYFKRESECRALLSEHRYAEAEARCRPLPELSKKLPSERQNDRRIANQLAGLALFSLKKYANALIFFQRELAIGVAHLNSTDAELGYAYRDLASCYHAMGQFQQAQSYYERAESTLRIARETIGSEFLKNEYAKSIQSVLRNHVVLLRQMGQEDAAAQAQQRADAIAREIHP